MNELRKDPNSLKLYLALFDNFRYWYNVANMVAIRAKRDEKYLFKTVCVAKNSFVDYLRNYFCSAKPEFIDNTISLLDIDLEKTEKTEPVCKYT